MSEMIDIQNLIDVAVSKRSQVKGEGRDRNYFHVSDAGTCYRKRYFKRLGIEPIREIPVGALRKMLAGDAGHEMLQKTLQYYGTLFAAEGEVSTHDIKGHYDAILKTDKSKVMWEIKTVEKWSMKYITEGGPKPEHELQMFTYWDFARHDYKDLDQATLTYVKREDFESKSFNYLWSSDIATKVLGEWQPLIRYWQSEELPPCTCPQDYGGNGVKYCRYISENEETCCDESLLITKEISEVRNEVPRIG